MNRIKRWWNSVSGKLVAYNSQPDDVTGRELCRMLQRCPVCGDGFGEHLYAHFAVTVMTEERNGKVKEFLRACEEHQWESVQLFQEFDARRDALVAYALRCQNGRLVALLERSPSESYEEDRLIACDVLDEPNSQRLGILISPGDWRRMQVEQ